MVTTMINDAARPGLVGVQTDDRLIPTEPLYRTIVWIDPKRDDMPIERMEIEDPPEKDAPRTYYRTQYLEHAQLPDGRWYPTHWERTSVNNGRVGSMKLIYRLQLFPGKKADPSWYTDPAKQFAGKQGRPAGDLP